MAHPSKPPVTGSSHPLPFEKLSPLDFERLCLWLVQREGFTRAEHLGEAGSESGRDVVAWKEGRRFVFQCKRVQAFSPAHARKEIEKLRKLPVEEQPDELVFVVSRTISADARKEIRADWGDAETCHFWSGSELDERAKRYRDLVNEFFQVTVDRSSASRPHNLPFPSLGSLFQGREEIIALLREKLTSTPAGRATAIAGKAVHGLGGVGKTRLAVEYAWKYSAEYTAVLFVGAESPAALRRNLAALCDRKILDLPEQEATKEEVREVAALRWFGNQPGWLLILDNVDSEEAAVAVDALVANLHGGHVLLTGRLARWGTGIDEIELDVLTKEAAAAFLLARTEKKRRPTPEDAKLAVVLARELGFLPLALEQAGAYIARHRRTFGAYLEEWKSKHDQVLTWFDARIMRYPASVATTWGTSFDRLSVPARRLLERLAWLGPEPIPETLLDVSVPESPEDEDPRDAFVELASYSLVTQDDETPSLTVHRLVQDVTRRSLRIGSDEESLMEALGGALRWVDTAFVGDPQDVRTWPILEPLAPHAIAVLAYADAAGIHDPTARLMGHLASLLHVKALFNEAELLMRRALYIYEQGFESEDSGVATALNNLAQLLRATNRLSEAEPLMWRSLEIKVQNFGPKHTDVATALNNLAQLLKATNRLNEAEPMMWRVLEIKEQSFGTQHPDVATALNNLASLLQDTNRLSEAEALMRRALKIDEQILGPINPNVARDLNNLAQLLQDTNRLGEAEPLMRRALDIDEQSLGPLHPDVAKDLNNLALLFYATNRLSEAEPLMRRGLFIIFDFVRRTGYEFPQQQVAFQNYAILLREMGKSDEEIKATLKALFQSPN
jgi:tetratricopeptide (TPR) repeat protein